MAAVQVTPTGGFANTTPVALTCVAPPAGITCGAASATGAAAGNLPLTLPAGLALGSYTLTVQGTAGTLTNTTTLVVQIAPPGSYALSLTPAAAAVPKGTASAATTVSVVGSGGWPSTLAVALTCPGAPAGITCNAATATAAQAAALTMSLPATLTGGNYTIPVKGLAGGVEQTATYVLTVTSSRSVNLPTMQAPVVNMSGTSNLASLTEWRLEFRLHGFTGYVGFNGVFELGTWPNNGTWGYLNTSGDLGLVVKDASGTYLSTLTSVAGLTDILVRVQRSGAGWSTTVWNYNGGSPVLLTTNYVYGSSLPGMADNLAQMWKLAGYSYTPSSPIAGNFAYFRLYPTAVTNGAAPLNALQAGALVAFEFEDSLADQVIPSRAWTPSGSGAISYVNTPQ